MIAQLNAERDPTAIVQPVAAQRRNLVIEAPDLPESSQGDLFGSPAGIGAPLRTLRAPRRAGEKLPVGTVLEGGTAEEQQLFTDVEKARRRQESRKGKAPKKLPVGTVLEGGTAEEQQRFADVQEPPAQQARQQRQEQRQQQRVEKVEADSGVATTVQTVASTRDVVSKGSAATASGAEPDPEV